MTETITSGQEARIEDFIRDLLRKELRDLGTDKLSAQRIVSRGGELQARFREVLIDLGAMRYKSEEVESSRGYPQGFAVRPICEQLLALKNFPLFANLDTSKALACSKNMRALPEGADGPAVFPRWQTIAKTYGEAVEKVFALLGQTRAFKNWREGQLGGKYLRESEWKAKAIAAISAAQEGDFIVIPVQLGMLHRGRSVRRAIEVMGDKEFGLGAYEVAILLLTHPDRFTSREDLFIDCAGDEYAPDADGRFNYAPVFFFDAGEVEFHTDWAGGAHDHYGSASGFLPQ